jgi:hypothetical protein
MMTFFSWLFATTFLVFIAYWLITFLLFSISFKAKVGMWAVEFYRLWLKPLFLINFFWFIIAEIAFSLVYWTSVVLLYIIPYFSPAILYLNRLHTDNPSFWSWGFYSVILFLIVMSPYLFLQHKLSYYFKNTLYLKLAKTFQATSARFLGQTGGFDLNKHVFTQLATRQETVINWIHQSLQDFIHSPGREEKRFSVDITSTDHMSWEINTVKGEYFEAVISFTGQQKFIEDGKVNYKDLVHEELFDGIIILLKDALEQPWQPVIFELDQSVNSRPKIRPIHKQGCLISIGNLGLKGLGRKSAITHSNTNPEQYFIPEKIKIEGSINIQYVACNEKNLYLFIRTDLENTAFDLNMNIPVRESIELFKRDLSIVQAAMSEVGTIKARLNEKFDSDSRKIPSSNA